MAQFITLERTPRVSPHLGNLSGAAREYIDKNHSWASIMFMAENLNVKPVQIINYCRERKYNPPAVNKAKPKEVKKDKMFCLEDYKKGLF